MLGKPDEHGLGHLASSEVGPANKKYVQR